jgi:hypothetical protein
MTEDRLARARRTVLRVNERDVQPLVLAAPDAIRIVPLACLAICSSRGRLPPQAARLS